MVLRVQVEVLRVADRCEHAAEVGCDSHEDEREHECPSVIEALQDRDGEGNECYQRDVVREEHRHDEREYRKKQTDASGCREFTEQAVCQEVECSDTKKDRDDEHEAHQDRENSEVDVARVFGVRRHDKTGYCSECS